VIQTTSNPKNEREAVIRITPPGDARALLWTASDVDRFCCAYKVPHRHVGPTVNRM
jgi:hypothetical protein